MVLLGIINFLMHILTIPLAGQIKNAIPFAGDKRRALRLVVLSLSLLLRVLPLMKRITLVG